MIHLGYCRVSTEKQSLDLQLAALTPICGDRIWQEKKSGMTQEGRTELAAVVTEAKRLRATGEDVMFCVYSLSRLGRKVAETLPLLEELQSLGIGFKSITESIDTSTPMGRCFLNIIASLAQMEAEVTRERTIAGLKAAKERGVKLGRKADDHSNQMTQAQALINKGMSMRSAATAVGMNISTLSRLLKAA